MTPFSVPRQAFKLPRGEFLSGSALSRALKPAKKLDLLAFHEEGHGMAAQNACAISLSFITRLFSFADTANLPHPSRRHFASSAPHQYRQDRSAWLVAGLPDPMLLVHGEG
jgi:hypothetical protein